MHFAKLRLKNESVLINIVKKHLKTLSYFGTKNVPIQRTGTRC